MSDVDLRDRELLEMAAKAAGLTLYEHVPGLIVTGSPETKDVDYERWNPLDNDGDALRLAVKLGMSISIDMTYGWTRISEYEDTESIVTVTHDEAGDLAATRRAIAEYAAIIGRAMT